MAVVLQVCCDDCFYLRIYDSEFVTKKCILRCCTIILMSENKGLNKEVENLIEALDKIYFCEKLTRGFSLVNICNWNRSMFHDFRFVAWS